VSRKRFWLTRVLPLTAAVLAVVVVAAFVVKARPGLGGRSHAPASQASQRPLPPAPVVVAVQRLQAQVDSPLALEDIAAILCSARVRDDP
jgi:hypothetical protein